MKTVVITKLAEMIGIAPVTASNWIKRGLLPKPLPMLPGYKRSPGIPLQEAERIAKVVKGSTTKHDLVLLTRKINQERAYAYYMKAYNVDNPPEASIEQSEVKEAVAETLNGHGLTPREREVIKMRFGLDGHNDCTLEQVASHFGVSRERIRQVEANALRKLRHPSRSEKLIDFFTNKTGE